MKQILPRLKKFIVKYNRVVRIIGILLLFSTSNLCSQEISKSFELRYLSDNPEANGETDFKGETAVFDTEQRVNFLHHWAEYG
ncbi:MAG: hypothetical protein ACOCTU_06555, partial [Bacteroidota bacterium]